MATGYSPKIVTDGLVFCWDGISDKSWDGSSSSHRDLVSKATGTKVGVNTLSRLNNHVDFDNSTASTRSVYISFASADINVPTGDQGTWIWAQYFQDAGSIDHPNFGKENGSSWDGDDGFVFGTGWGTDGPRWGIAGTAHDVYNDVGSSTGDYRQNVWQIYAVTYTRNSATGVKTYLLDSNGNRLVNQRTSSDVAIGSNSNNLYIGATNNRGGNWNGLMDFLYMYNRALTASEIQQNYNALKGRFGL